MVHVVGAQGGAGQLLQEIIFFVGALGRDQNADGIRPIFGLDLLQTFRHPVQSFIPGGRPEFFALPDQRVR